MRDRKNRMSGNALFMILIAIFLLGGLTAMMMRTSEQSDESGNDSRDAITASKLITYAATMESAITDLKMRGCGEGQISFWADSNSDGIENASDENYNPNAPVNRSCHVYYIAGAGVEKQKALFDTVCISAFVDIGTQAKDLYIWTRNVTGGALPADGLGKSLCNQINKQLGNGFDINNLPQASLSGQDYSNGDLTTGLIFGDAGAELGMAGFKSGCIKDGAHYTFYDVVMTR